MTIPSGPGSLPVPGLALVILDGWGLADAGPGQRDLARPRRRSSTRSGTSYPHTPLSACGHDVGLPDGQMGNSEVGHLNLGAGAIVKQDLARIDDAVADGSFFENEVLVGACERARKSPRGRLHLVGLVSDGGVHSGWEHIEACIELAAREGVPDLVVHAFTDGRDTLPDGGAGYVAEARALAAQRRPDRHGRRPLLRRWTAIIAGSGRSSPTTRSSTAPGPRAATAGEAVADAYEARRHRRVHQADGDRRLRRRRVDGDVVIPFNFRPDRVRQIVAALGEPAFDEFERGGDPGLDISTMTAYRGGWPYPVAFPPHAPETTIAEVISEAGGRQLHVAETEKYAHVTYFFNGGREREWSGEERRLVESPRDVPTYDHQPEMSAEEAADAFCSAWGEGDFRFGIINFANPDMVGHTGVDPGGGERRRGGRRAASPGSSRRSTRPAAPASSPPTTATPSTCSSPTARPNTAHSTQPGAGDRHRRTGSSCARRHPRRRRADRPRPARHRPARRHDRRVAPDRPVDG